MAEGGNLVALAGAQVFRVGSGFALNVLLMRALGVEGFGVHGTVLTAVGIASFGANLGMERLINREVARAPGRAAAFVSAGLFATATLSAATAGVLVAWAIGFDGRATFVAATALAAAALGVRSLALVPEAAFHGRRAMGPPATGQMIGRVVLVAGTAALVAVRPDVVAVYAAQLLDATAVFAWTWAAWRRVEGWAATTVAEVSTLVRDSVPFGLNTLFGSVYLTVDVLLLAALRDDVAVGHYRGAVSLIALFPVIAQTLTAGLYPRMARWVGDPRKAGEELGFAYRILLGVAVPAAVGGALLAEPLLVTLGGAAYAASAPLFFVLAPVLPLRFVNHAAAMALSTLDRQADRTWGTALAAVVNIGLNVWWIPSLGAMGCALATVATEALLVVWFLLRVRPVVAGTDLLGSSVRWGLAGLGMGAVVWGLDAAGAPVLVTVGIGAAVSIVLGRVAGAWSPADLRRLRRV